MATNVIATIRQCARLRGSVRYTAIEVSHLMNSAGLGRVSYAMMSHKTGFSRRTMITHMHKLVALGIFRKTVYRLKFGNAINLYTCLVPLVRLSRTAPRNIQGERASRTLPTPGGEEEKALSLQEELARLKKGLRFLTNPDTPMYQSCVEKIAALEAMQRTP